MIITKKYLSILESRLFNEFSMTEYPHFVSMIKLWLDQADSIYYDSNGNIKYGFWRVLSHLTDFIDIDTVPDHFLKNLMNFIAVDFGDYLSRIPYFLEKASENWDPNAYETIILYDDQGNIKYDYEAIRNFLRISRQFFKSKGDINSYYVLFRMFGGTLELYDNSEDILLLSSPTDVSSSSNIQGQIDILFDDITEDEKNSIILAYNLTLLRRNIPVSSFINFVTSEPSTPKVGHRFANNTTGTSNITHTSVKKYNTYEWNGTSWIEIETTPNYISEINFVTSEPLNKNIDDIYLNLQTGVSNITSTSVVINHLYRWTGLIWEDLGLDSKYKYWVTSKIFIDLPNDAPVSPSIGTLYYNTNTGTVNSQTVIKNRFYYWNGDEWKIGNEFPDYRFSFERGIDPFEMGLNMYNAGGVSIYKSFWKKLSSSEWKLTVIGAKNTYTNRFNFIHGIDPKYISSNGKNKKWWYTYGSYTIITNLRQDLYEDIVKQLIHPIGFNLTWEQRDPISFEILNPIDELNILETYPLSEETEVI